MTPSKSSKMKTSKHSADKDTSSVAVARKCPNCGTMLGQKNICPVCNPQNASGKEIPSQKNVPMAEVPVPPAPMSDELSLKAEKFVKDHLKNWNLEFDSFYVGLEKEHSDLDYRKLLESCKRWEIIFKDVQTLVSQAKNKITGDLMVKAMDELHGKYPEEIDERKARELVREFASIKENSAQQPEVHVILMPAAGNSVKECFLSKWNIKVGDIVKKGDIIATAETNKKTSVEVEATEEGTVLALFAAERQWVPVLKPICLVGTVEGLSEYLFRAVSDGFSNSSDLFDFLRKFVGGALFVGGVPR